MRLSAGLVIATAITGLVVLQQRRESGQAQQPTAAIDAAAAPTGQAGQRHWPTRALDRAADVKRQLADQRKGDERP